MAKDLYQQVGRMLQSGISSVQTAVQHQYTGSNFYPTTLELQHSMKNGWLRKQGSVVKSWQKRWFTIKGDYIYYYANIDETKSPLGVIFLPGNRVVEHAFNASESDKFLFEIIPDVAEKQRSLSTHESYPLAAESDEERKEWVKAIKHVLYASVGGAIFGRSLEETLQFEMVRDRKRKIPEIVQLCAEYLLEKGIDEEGIFRLPGRSILIKQLCDAFDRGERPVIDVPEMDVHTAASLFKCYLRELPGPLIPVAFYEPVMWVVMREMPIGVEKALDKLSQLIQNIPMASYNVLQYVCQFLHKIASHSGKNKMTSVNLATVFVQAFIRPEEDDPALLMATASSRTVATLVLIDKSEKVFNLEYTTEGTVVIVDDLLGLNRNDDEIAANDIQAPGLTLNVDLLGLSINDAAPVPALRRHAGKFSAQNRSVRSEFSMDILKDIDSVAECQELRAAAKDKRRGAMMLQNSRSSNESSDEVEEAVAKSPSSVKKPSAIKRVESLNSSNKGSLPVAPPRLGHEKAKTETKLTTAKMPATVGSDSVAVETLININTQNLTESELRLHIDRLCTELKVRQKIIEDLSAQSCLTEQKHEKQIDALMKKMSEDRGAVERCSKKLKLYREKYGDLT